MRFSMWAYLPGKSIRCSKESTRITNSFGYASRGRCICSL